MSTANSSPEKPVIVGLRPKGSFAFFGSLPRACIGFLIAVFCAIEPMKNATGVFPTGLLFHGAAGVALLSPIWRPLLDKATGAPVKTRSGRKSRTPKRYQ